MGIFSTHFFQALVLVCFKIYYFIISCELKQSEWEKNNCLILKGKNHDSENIRPSQHFVESNLKETWLYSCDCHLSTSSASSKELKVICGWKGEEICGSWGSLGGIAGQLLFIPRSHTFSMKKPKTIPKEQRRKFRTLDLQGMLQVLQGEESYALWLGCRILVVSRYGQGRVVSSYWWFNHLRWEMTVDL